MNKFPYIAAAVTFAILTNLVHAADEATPKESIPMEAVGQDAATKSPASRAISKKKGVMRRALVGQQATKEPSPEPQPQDAAK